MPETSKIDQGGSFPWWLEVGGSGDDYPPDDPPDDEESPRTLH